MKSNVLQSDDFMAPNMRVQKSQIDPHKFYKFDADEVSLDFGEFEEELEENDNDIDYNQVLSLANLNLLLAKTI